MVVDDLREIRECLALLFNGTAGFRSAGVHATMERALEALARSSRLPDVALVDIGLPGMSGIEGIRVLRERYPAILPIVLTVYEDDGRIFDALCAGACGYLLKKTPPAQLLACIRDVADGGAPMSPEVARRVIAIFREIHPPERAGHQLTPHEIRLLALLVEGHNYKTAAAELGVTVHTISFHLRSIYGKLHVHSKTEAVAKALRHGLIR
ncbi:MAG TPA: response regulator transcription factor [Vicinamibacterales bacterium]